MSMNFNQPVNPEALRMIEEVFGKPVVSDGKTLLFDNMGEIDSRDMRNIANAAKQPAIIEIHGGSDIKVMADGTRYQVTPNGWRRLAGS